MGHSLSHTAPHHCCISVTKHSASTRRPGAAHTGARFNSIMKQLGNDERDSAAARSARRRCGLRLRLQLKLERNRRQHVHRVMMYSMQVA